MSTYLKEKFAKRAWLIGGIIGVVICLILYLFYTFVYFPAFTNNFANNPSDNSDILSSNNPDSTVQNTLPSYALLLPTVTGHVIPMMAHFLVPYGMFCEFTEPVCVLWGAKINLDGSEVKDCVPWTMDGTEGCCMKQITQPTSECADHSEMIGSIALLVILFIIYFMVGAMIGSFIQRRKSDSQVRVK